MKITLMHPLQWPEGRPREKYPRSGSFKSKANNGWMEDVTLHQAMMRLVDQCELLKATDCILTSNIDLNRDGSPKARQPLLRDYGAALYMRHNGKPIVLPCDSYTEVAQNVAAIAAHIQATRAIERYGVGTAEAMFTGFAALPSQKAEHWRTVLDIPANVIVTPALIHQMRRDLSKRWHPDAGGSATMMAKINAACDAALREIG